MSGLLKCFGDKSSKGLKRPKSTRYAGRPDKLEKGSFQLNITASNLKSEDIISQNDTYMVIKLSKNIVYTSEVHKNNNNPTFYPVFFKDSEFSKSDELNIEFWDKDTFTKDDFIGQVTISVSKLRETGTFKTDVTTLEGKSKGNFSANIVKPEKVSACWIDELDGVEKSIYYKLYTDAEVKAKGEKRELLYISEKVKGLYYPIFDEDVANLSMAELSLYVEICSHDDVIAAGPIAFPFTNGRYHMKGSDDCVFVIGEAVREVSLVASADGLKDLDWIGKSDPQYTVEYEGKVVYKSEESDDYAAPVWEKAFFKKFFRANYFGNL